VQAQRELLHPLPEQEREEQDFSTSTHTVDEQEEAKVKRAASLAGPHVGG
jgi:hypothetical protein